jgi:thiol-disulfide isomerase/thioredoxin
MKRAQVVDIALIVICVAALGLTGAAWSEVHRSHATSPAPRRNDLGGLVHKKLPSFDVLVNGGGSRVLPVGGWRAPRMFLVFRSDCPACEHMAPLWESLIDSLAGQADIVAVNWEGAPTAQRWLDQHGIRVTELAEPTALPRLLSAWGLSAVPATILTDKDGNVLRADVGALTPLAADSIRIVVATLSRNRT